MPLFNDIIFDLDGTLFETARVDVPAYRQSFASHGLAPPSAQQVCDTLHLNSFDSVRLLSGSNDDTLIASIVEQLIALELTLISQHGRLYSGVKAMLERTRALGLPLTLCSNGPQAYVQRVLQEMDIACFFSQVTAYQPGLDKSQVIAQMLARRQIGSFALVGDSVADEQAALSNGGIFIYAQYGYGTLSVNHMYTASRPGQIDALLASALRAP